MGLPEAADLLGVHYMTAYRYVRTGRLPATSVDGVWRVDPADVRALRGRSAPARRRAGGSAGRAARMVERRLIEGDQQGAFAVLETALGSWASPTDVYLEVLVPAMRSIGERWAAGELGVADEHRAATVAQRLIGRLGTRFARAGRRRGSVVVGAPAGERHAIPVAVVADLLRAAGFEVADLGADTPPEAFVSAARAADRLAAVAIGVTVAGNDGGVAETVGLVHDAVPGVPVIVGGAGIPDPETARRMGADHWSGTDGATVVRLVGGEPDAAPPTGAGRPRPS